MWLTEPLCWLSWCIEGVLFIYALAVVATESRASRRAATPLRAGPITRVGPVALEGVVMTHGEPAITVRIDEVGQFINPETGWRGLLFGARRRRMNDLFTPLARTFIRWREFDRAMEVRPFTLQLDDGTRVRVVPDDAVHLVDDLVKAENIEHDHRVRRVSLDHGERAFVTGVLRVDRSMESSAPTGTSHVVRSGGQHRLLISTHAIDTVHTERAKRYGYVALGTLATALLTVASAVISRSPVIPLLLTSFAAWFGIHAYRRMRPWWEGATFDEER